MNVGSTSCIHRGGGHRETGEGGGDREGGNRRRGRDENVQDRGSSAGLWVEKVRSGNQACKWCFREEKREVVFAELERAQLHKHTHTHAYTSTHTDTHIREIEQREETVAEQILRCASSSLESQIDRTYRHTISRLLD